MREEKGNITISPDENTIFWKISNAEFDNIIQASGSPEAAAAHGITWTAVPETACTIVSIPITYVQEIAAVAGVNEIIPFLKTAGAWTATAGTAFSAIRGINGEISLEEFLGTVAVNATSIGLSIVTASVVGVPAIVAATIISVSVAAAFLSISDNKITEFIGSFLADGLRSFYAHIENMGNSIASSSAQIDQGYWGAQYARYKTCEATALTPPYRDPLVLDLDKDGGTSPSRRAYFDYDGDGTRELGSWFSSNDGLLAIDKNGDGAINDGSELFGDAFVKENGAKASNGMDALRDIDGNDDGVIDAQDEKFADLRIWKDTNGDGVSQAEEIHTLEELGVMSLGTSSEAVNQTDALGNTQINAGAFTFFDGTEGAMGDWSLQVDNMATKYDYTLTEEQKAAIEGLPYIASVGGLRPLDYAMANNETLTAHIRELCDPATGALRQYELMDQILYEWAGVSHIEAGSRGGFVDARQLAVMEKIFKDRFSDVRGHTICSLTHAAVHAGLAL